MSYYMTRRRPLAHWHVPPKCRNYVNCGGVASQKIAGLEGEAQVCDQCYQWARENPEFRKLLTSSEMVL